MLALKRGAPPPKKIRVFSLARQVLQIKRIVAKERFDVFHAFGHVGTAQLSSLLRLAGLRAPVVVTMLSSEYSEAHAASTPVCTRSVDAFITATDTVTRRMGALGISVHTIRHGNLRDFHAELDGGVTKRHRVLYWRELTLENGADICIEAFDKVADDFPDIHFDFAIRSTLHDAPGIQELSARHPNVRVYRFPYPEGISLPKLVLEFLLLLVV